MSGCIWGQNGGGVWEHYQVVLWSTGTPVTPQGWPERVREAGYTAVPVSPGSEPLNGLAFYMENLVAGLAFHHSRQALYDADWRGYSATHDKRYLVRKPCFDDPAFWQQATAQVSAAAQRYGGRRPLLYDLRDEPSIGSFTSPVDYCFCPYTLRAFREWLKGRYGSLAAFNAEWETAFPRWEDVMPLTTYEIKDRERAELAAGRRENYAPWADHREYMDWSFAQALDRMRAIIRRYDPTTPVGIEGTQMPAAWGGYDLWRLSQAVDWMEPYDVAGSRAILGSFLPAGAPVLNTYFGSDARGIRREAWARLLAGDRGAVVWDDDPERVILKAIPGMPLTARGRDLRGIFAAVGAAVPQFQGLRREGDGIAIYYSQAGIRAHWMFDSREDGRNWPRRLASYETTHSRLAQARISFLRVVQDLGLTPGFVSYEQVEKGELTRQRYRVLLLPQTVALSAAECRRIEEFVRAGGVVIADNMPAEMDEHGRRLPAGQLDGLFGVHRRERWKPAATGPAAPSPVRGAEALQAFDADLAVAPGAGRAIAGAPMAVRRQTGRGWTCYLNLDMHGYAGLRDAWPRGANYLALFRTLFADAGIQIPVRVEGAHEVQVVRFLGKGLERVALLRNPNQPAKGPVPPEATARIHITLGRRAHVREGTRDLGTGREFDLELDPWTPALLELRDR